MSPGYSSPETIVLDSNNEYGYVLGLGSSGSASHSIINRIRLSDNIIVPFLNNAPEILIFNTTGLATDITLGPMVIDSTDTYLYVLSPYSIYKISIATGITTNVFYPPFGQFAGDIAISSDNIPYIYASFFGGGISPPVISTSYPYVAKINTSTGAVFNILVSKDDYYTQLIDNEKN